MRFTRTLAFVLCATATAAAAKGGDNPNLLSPGERPEISPPVASPDAITRGEGAAGEHRQVVNLLSRRWRFDAHQPALSTLSSQHPQAAFPAPADSKHGFTIRFTLNLKPFEGEITVLEIPDVVRVWLRRHDPRDRNRQNYPAFKMPDGSLPVLEANVVLHSAEHPEWKDMTIGIPLAMLDRPTDEREVVLSFTGVDWKMYVDGAMLDNDYPFGWPAWAATNRWTLNPAYVGKAEIHVPGVRPDMDLAHPPDRSSGIQYWLPRGHNNWVGDVQTCYHKGRYHVFYLYDRRHHQSKFGRGAHYFEHLSTTDFRTWTEHEAATPLEDQWECIGTGVPFVFNGRLYLSYGLHTTRVYPESETTLPAQWEYLKAHGRTGGFPRATTPGVPAGATYSVSADGVAKFKKSQIMFHPCQNPSVYIDPGGKLRMLANYGSRGIWESDSLDGGWRCVRESFPPGGDCTIFFRWGKYDYIIGGFTGLWSKPASAPDSAYEDVVREGLDFYDGSNVPSITEIAGGRFLMAAWIPIRGWGGPLVIRELIQFPDGRIGSKWMNEVLPEIDAQATLGATVSQPATFQVDDRSFLLEFNVHPAEIRKGKVAVVFLPGEGERDACELRIDLQALRAQFAPGSLAHYAKDERSLREGGAPHQAGNYAVENLIGLERPFAVRVVVHGNDKLGGSLIDVEVAGQRTLISYRPDLAVKKLLLRPDGVELKNVRISAVRAAG